MEKPGPTAGIVYYHWVTLIFFSNSPTFAIVATRVGRGRNWLTSFNYLSPLPVGLIMWQLYLIQAQLKLILRPNYPKLATMSTRAVVIQFDWQNSIAWTQKHLMWYKNPGHISYASRVIANFAPNFPNFYNRATRVGWRKIWMTPFNYASPKTPVRCKNLRHISYICVSNDDVLYCRNLSAVSLIIHTQLLWKLSLSVLLALLQVEVRMNR